MDGDIEDLALEQVEDSGDENERPPGDENERPPRELLLPPPVRVRRPQEAADADLDAAADEAVGTVPGTARVWIRTMGCAHNVADSEVMAGVLMAQGYRVAMEGQAAAGAAGGGAEDGARAEAAAKDAADVWLLNSCTVKDPSEAAVGSVLREAAASGKAVVVAGCVPQGERGARVLKPPPATPATAPIAVGLVGVAQLGRVAEVVEAAVRGESVSLLGRGRGDRALPSAELPQARRNPRIAIVPLSQGCLGACTYCKTVHARGALSSYAPEQIEARVVAAARDPHVREIHLSSEDVGAYGRDRGTSLAALLARLTAALDAVAEEHGQLEPEEGEGGEGGQGGAGVEGALDASSGSGSGSDDGGGDDGGDEDGGERRSGRSRRGARPRPRRLHRVRLRVGMSNPPFLLRDGALGPVSRALRHPAVYRWLHLPVQSGDDGVLRRMNREYTVADFEACVEGLRERVPGLVVATDVIVGFPGEDDAAFEATLDLLRRHRFPSAHCTKFYPRPGTPAARYRPRVPTAVQKARSAAAAYIIDGRDVGDAAGAAAAGAAAAGAAAAGAAAAGAGKDGRRGDADGSAASPPSAGPPPSCYSPYRAMVGTVQRVVVVDVAADGVSLVAHARNFAQVLLAPAPGLMGAVADARVVSASRWSVKGEVVRVLYSPPPAGTEEEAGESKAAASTADAAAAAAAAKARARVLAAREKRAAAAAQKQEQEQEGLPPLPSTPPKQAGAAAPLPPSSPSLVAAAPLVAPPLPSPASSSRLASVLISAGCLLLLAALLALGATTLRDVAALAGQGASLG